MSSIRLDHSDVPVPDSDVENDGDTGLDARCTARAPTRDMASISILLDFEVEVEGHLLKPKFSSGISQDVEAKLYPGWHQWLSHESQDRVAYYIFFAGVGWSLLSAGLGMRKLEDERIELQIVLPLLKWVPPILSYVLLFGQLSKCPKPGAFFSPALLFLNLFLAFFSPRLVLPLLSGVFSAYFIFLALNMICEHGVIQWHEKSTLVNYLSWVPLFFGPINCLLFVNWCEGNIPALFYIQIFPLLQLVTTAGEYEKGEASFDYVVTKRVYRRLIFFRFGILSGISLTAMYLQNLMMVNGVMSESLWNCKPMRW